ncbi:MAG: restriction endonuclease [Flavobacteriales bacterium]|nr:restriction endonuclease [Flavobacteriales bacterium]
MAVPDFQSTMLPLLKHVSDRKEYALKNVVTELAASMKLTEQEESELLSSGQTRFYNRVAWASIYLRRAGLMTSPKRGALMITPRGQEVLEQKPWRIDIAFLKRYPEFVVFQNAKRDQTITADVVEVDATRTPEEVLDNAYEQIRSTLGQEVLSKVLALSWMDFERIVVQLLVRMGYGGSMKDAGRALAKSGDEGIDGTIKEDRLGLDIIYIQAKKWQTGNTVGRPEIQKFVGALAGQGAKKGIFITTSGFSKEARDYVPRNETKIVLIDGEELTQLMIDHDLGVTPQRTYSVKRIDGDFFGEE